jgi:nucleoside-diphosphate-sugar epimerase
MKIAIIGCGYVGTAVAQKWKADGHFITATTTTQERIQDLEKVADQVVLMKGNDVEKMQLVLQNQDIVLLSVGAHRRDLYEETYLETAKTLIFAVKNVANVQQVIYTGTYSVYGNRNGEWVSEETPLSPSNENSQILAETEQILLSVQSETLRVCILRLGGIYGSGRELIDIFGQAAGTTRPGTGEDFTNWIHLDDIVAALELARMKQLTGIYNLVNDQPVQRYELLEHLFTHYGLAQVLWDTSQPPTRSYNVRVSNQKIKAADFQLLHPQITFPSSIN